MTVMLDGSHIMVANNNGLTLVHVASSNGHVKVVKLLLEKGADIMVATNDGWTPVNAASSNGHVEVVKLLLERGRISRLRTGADGRRSIRHHKADMLTLLGYSFDSPRLSLMLKMTAIVRHCSLPPGGAILTLCSCSLLLRSRRMLRIGMAQRLFLPQLEHLSTGSESMR